MGQMTAPFKSIPVQTEPPVVIVLSVVLFPELGKLSIQAPGIAPAQAAQVFMDAARALAEQARLATGGLVLPQMVLPPRADALAP